MEYSQLFQQASHRVRSPTNIYFFQHAVMSRLKPAQTHYTRGSDPVAACCRSVRFFDYSAIAPRAVPLWIFTFQPCVEVNRLRPFYLTIMVQTGSQSQQNSSQLLLKQFFFQRSSHNSVVSPVVYSYFFSHMVSHAAACSLPSQDYQQGAQWIRPYINSF